MGAAGKEKRAKELPGTKKRGGRRPGAGGVKPSKSYSEQIKEDVMAALKAKEKETGMSFGQVVVEEIYQINSRGNLRGICMKLVADMLSIREVKNTNINTDVLKPNVYIPAYKPIQEDEPVPMQTH